MPKNEAAEISEVAEAVIVNGEVELKAVRATMTTNAIDYVEKLAKSTGQDKGVILEIMVNAFKALDAETKKKHLMEVLSSRMNF